jgi:SAM-dependent methyltransferase
MLKLDVHDFWEQESCGETYAVGSERAEQLRSHARTRYALEPYIPAFARFEEGTGRRVLEIGVGMGADHVEWARHRPALLVGLDFTSRALDHTKARLHVEGCESRLLRADAEQLPFAEGSFELVYSWGVLHHSSDTAQAIREVHRVVAPGGIAGDDLSPKLDRRRPAVVAVRARLRPTVALFRRHLRPSPREPGNQSVFDCRGAPTG